MHFLHAARARLAGLAGVTILCWSVGTPAAAEPDAKDPKVAALEAELERTKSELGQTQDALAALSRRVDGMQPAAGSQGSQAPAGATARLAPVNANNPAISFVVDTQGRSSTREGAGFGLFSGELFLSGPIDPFVRGYASINATSDEGFDLEEAALVTTALPWNLTVKGGRFFADVGRFAHWHSEALPFVDRPRSIDELVGGESGAEGVELSWLAPIEHFVQITTGLYNSVGSERREEGFGYGKRSFSELSWLVRPQTYFDLTDSLNAEIGGTWLTVPQGQRRNLYGVDVVLRHQPGTSGFYQGTVIGAEWMWNAERFRDERPLFDETGAPLLVDPADPASAQVFGTKRFNRSGGYAYLESFFGRRFSGGFRFDRSEPLRDEPLDTAVVYATPNDVPGFSKQRENDYSLFVTWYPSEFQRLRLQGDWVTRSGSDEQRIALQWTAFIGSHSHGFANR